MEVISKQLQQIVAIYKSMSTPARVTTSLLMVAIVLSLVFLFQFQLGAGETYLYGGRDFSQSELAAMEDALGQAGLNDYELAGNKIKVPRSQRDTYVRAIAEAGATPRMAHEYDSLTQTSFNPFASREQQQQQRKAIDQQKFSRMIEDMTGVEHATVHFDEDVEPGLRRRVRLTAAVSVKAAGTRSLSLSEIKSIRDFVLGLRAGLEPDDITILDVNTGEAHRTPENGDILEQNQYAQLKKYWEDYYRKAIEQRLQPYRPNVAVSVETSDTLSHIEHQRTLDSTPVVVGSTSERNSSTNATTPGGGIPGVPANNNSAANATAQVSSAGETRESSEESSSEVSQSIVGGSVAEIQRAGLMVNTVKVSIGIPRSFYEEKWLTENPPAEGEDPQAMPDTYLMEQEQIVGQEIEDIVRPLIPQQAQGEDIYRYVVVKTDPDLEVTEPELPGMSDHALAWLANNWQTIGLLAVGLVGLVMLRGVIKGATPEIEVAPESEEDDAEMEELAAAAAAAQGDGQADDLGPPNQLKQKFGSSGRSLKEELTELVEEDLDAAASVLRTWIGDVG